RLSALGSLRASPLGPRMCNRRAACAGTACCGYSSEGIASLARVFIVGGGFGGLAAAQALARAPVALTVVDRRNHHVFQPLLYQVATAALSPADICAPIRTVLRDQDNCEVLLAQVAGVDPARRVLQIDGRELEYDYLVLAAGATHAYFGHDE